MQTVNKKADQEMFEDYPVLCPQKLHSNPNIRPRLYTVIDLFYIETSMKIENDLGFAVYPWYDMSGVELF